MKKLCVLFGGQSSEHDVSIITGMQLAKAIEKKYKIEKIYLGLDNKFYLASDIEEVSYFYNKKSIKLKEINIFNGKICINHKFFKKYIDIDCVINCCHGGVGENGDLAGFFEVQRVKYTSAGSLASHIAMDKFLAKKVVKDIVPTIEGVLVTKENFDEAITIINEILSVDLIVKPNSLGSSIGVKACSREDFKEQIDAIFEMGDNALVEKRVVNLYEYNQACIATRDGLITSCIERPITKSEILSFEDKYCNGEKSSKGNDRIIPADIDKNTQEKITDMTKKIYSALNMKGVVRIDYIMDRDSGEIYFNEINTVPGSMSFYLYEPLGIDYITLVEMLIDSPSDKSQYKYYETDILKDKKI